MLIQPSIWIRAIIKCGNVSLELKSRHGNIVSNVSLYENILYVHISERFMLTVFLKKAFEHK